jgi:Cu(I)/Ag(I) efflux system membrane protein CusA/SilA
MNNQEPPVQTPEQRSLIGRFMRFCLTNRLVVALFTFAIIMTGLLVAPFDWDVGGLQRYPVPVDAIPDIGENQQIVFTQWMGRSPQDMEDQISYPLTVSLLGIPDVKTIRSYSMFGFSTIYIIFKEQADFYDSRTRVLEKLNSLPSGTLPDGVTPVLGPDSTALGQIFWYTLEGRDENGNPTGGWSQEELRSLQDWQVRYGLLSADGVSEVGSIGGYVKEYQVDVDPDAMRAYGVTLNDVFSAVKAANIDVGAKTIEMNRAEYFIRGIGFIKEVKDIENSVVKVRADHVPVLVKQVAHVTEGPAARRGALDKGGAPAVGGVVVARYGDNPLAVINRVKDKIDDIAPALPKKTLADGTVSHVEIVPFYDRTGLIYETLGTLNDSIVQEILITIIVVLIMVMHLRSSLLISGMLPLAVLLCFIAMKFFGVQANIVALSGIVIAIGTIVDMGIVVCENILRHIDMASPDEARLETVHRAVSEVGGAVFTAVMTTVVSFLPVFTMIGAEGKLFKPLAFTKTFALLASILIALAVLPPAAYLLFGKRKGRALSPSAPPRTNSGSAGGVALPKWLKLNRLGPNAATWIIVLLVGIFLTNAWEPLGPEKGFIRNILFVSLLVGGLLGFFKIFQHFYARMLRGCLRHKAAFLSIPLLLMVLGATAWLGFDTTFGWMPDALQRRGAKVFPGFGKEFMPPLDEGSFLWMPTTMTHASIGEATDILATQDQLIGSVPEIESVVGKLGRADTPLDPAPISMFETVINYKSEYITDTDGRRLNFKYKKGEFVRGENGELIPDSRGRPFRQWRDEIRTPDDIWKEIVKVAKLPGTTSAPKLQPIAARIVMLQSGMRAPMGVKVKGPDLDTIEQVGLQIERFLKELPSVEASAVVADRIVGKPYLEIVPDREALARYGIPIRMFQDVIEIAIGGRQITTTVEGRERYPVRVRYPRELRDSVESMGRILVPAMSGQQIPITELAKIRYVRGPQVIKSEDTFLIGYVVFDKTPGVAEVDVVEEAQAYLLSKIDSGEFVLPKGVSYTFAGSYENQIRAAKTLSLILPIALFAIFMLIYFQFKSVSTTAIVFSGIFVAWSGGFLLVWLYGQPWFLDFSLFGVDMRTLFQVHTINMSVAVWVGFLALFGIASDNGVIQSTYLDQVFRENKPSSKKEIHSAVVEAAQRRVRPCLMTSATTILALIPVLTSTGRGSDVMVPMAIPSFGGMLVVLISIFVVPVLYCSVKERQIRKNGKEV